MPWLERLMVGWVCVICLTTCLPTRSECGGAYPQKKVMCRKKKDYCARSLTVGNSLCWRMYTGVLLVLTGSTCQNPRKGITYINCQYFLYFLSCIVLNNSRLYISSPGTSLFVCFYSIVSTHWAGRSSAVKKGEMTATGVVPVSGPCVQISTLI